MDKNLTLFNSSNLNQVSASGPLKIDWTRKYSLPDNSGNKVIQLRVTYPVAPGNYPVVILSHGAGYSKEGYRFLVRHWAQAGYICLQPTHDDSIDILRLSHNVPDLMALAMKCAGDPVYWLSRVKDIEHIMASLATIAGQLPAGVTMDEKTLAIAGHSFGAFTTQLLAGATPDIPAGVIAGLSGLTSFANRLPKAFVLLSPQGIQTPGLGLPNQSAWSNMTPPVMVITGSLDNGLQGQPARWRTEPFQYAPTGDKYLAYINGADHMACAGKPLASSATSLAPSGQQPAPDLFSYIAEVSLSFINAYLKADQAARQSLIDHDLYKASSGIVEQDDK